MTSRKFTDDVQKKRAADDSGLAGPTAAPLPARGAWPGAEWQQSLKRHADRMAAGRGETVTPAAARDDTVAFIFVPSRPKQAEQQTGMARRRRRPTHAERMARARESSETSMSQHQLPAKTAPRNLTTDTQAERTRLAVHKQLDDKYPCAPDVRFSHASWYPEYERAVNSVQRIPKCFNCAVQPDYDFQAWACARWWWATPTYATTTNRPLRAERWRRPRADTAHMALARPGCKFGYQQRSHNAEYTYDLNDNTAVACRASADLLFSALDRLGVVY